MLVTGNLTPKIAVARRVAFEVLELVHEGGYASDALRAKTEDLSGRDAGLATQIVFGCLRYQAQLDFLILKYSGKQVSTLDQAVKIALRAAILQVRYLERIPKYAAVHDSVEYVKRHKRAATAFANAVLRKLDCEPVIWPNAATEMSCPEWMLERWSNWFGAETAEAIARAALKEPEQYVRLANGATPPENTTVEETDVSGAYRVMAGSAQGMRSQDIGSQAIVPLLDLRPGNSYLDLCAAPGNKTMQALETPLSLAIACDISERRLRGVPPACSRVVLDAAEPLPFDRTFDRIFIDAPCSGTGTLARNPEIKWRLRVEDLTRFAQLQESILRRAMESLAPGGRLVYATCSLEREENDALTRKFLDQSPDVALVGEWRRLPGREAGDGFYAAAFEK